MPKRSGQAVSRSREGRGERPAMGMGSTERRGTPGRNPAGYKPAATFGHSRLKTCGHVATGTGSPERGGPAEAEILRFA